MVIKSQGPHKTYRAITGPQARDLTASVVSDLTLENSSVKAVITGCFSYKDRERRGDGPILKAAIVLPVKTYISLEVEFMVMHF